MKIEALYANSRFNDYLVMIANKNRLDDFDDFKQDLMVKLLEDGYKDTNHAEQIAKNLAQRIKYDQIKKQTYSLIENNDSYNGSANSTLWEDNHRI